MAARDDDRPEWDRHRPDRDDYVSGPPKKSPAKAILGGMFSLAVGYALLAYNLGWFPFAGITGNKAYIKDIVTKQLNIPIEKVEVTDDTTAVGTLASGEKLAIRWKRTGNEIKCMCQKPKAEIEGWVRSQMSMNGQTAASVDISPATGGGIGYVGTAKSTTGQTFRVTEKTDMNAMTWEIHLNP